MAAVERFKTRQYALPRAYLGALWFLLWAVLTFVFLHLLLEKYVGRQGFWLALYLLVSLTILFSVELLIRNIFDRISIRSSIPVVNNIVIPATPDLVDVAGTVVAVPSVLVEPMTSHPAMGDVPNAQQTIVDVKQYKDEPHG